MNEQDFGTKMEKDGTKVKNAFNTLVGDGVSKLKEEYDEFTGTVKNNANEAASSIRKDVNHGMEQYNSKAQEVADKLPFSISQTVSNYPWVVISLGLIFGFMLGTMLKPSNKSR